MTAGTGTPYISSIARANQAGVARRVTLRVIAASAEGEGGSHARGTLLWAGDICGHAWRQRLAVGASSAASGD